MNGKTSAVRLKISKTTLECFAVYGITELHIFYGIFIGLTDTFMFTITSSTLAISTATVTTHTTTSRVTATTTITAAANSTSTAVVHSTFINSPTLSASSDDNSSSVGVIVAIVVLVVVVFIIITVVVVGIIVAWKRNKSGEHSKQEGIYYSTIDEVTLQSPPNKQINKMNNEQSNREPQYMEISKTSQCSKQIEKVTMQDNPAYTEHEYPVKMEMCESAYSTNQTDKLTIQDNPSYSILCEHNIKMEDNPAYSVSFDTKQ